MPEKKSTQKIERARLSLLFGMVSAAGSGACIAYPPGTYGGGGTRDVTLENRGLRTPAHAPQTAPGRDPAGSGTGGGDGGGGGGGH